MCKKRRFVTIRRFRCPWCGQEMIAPKMRGPTHSGHVKTMYCPMCQTDRDFIQTDTDKMK